jgi:hypothetical protein
LSNLSFVGWGAKDSVPTSRRIPQLMRIENQGGPVHMKIYLDARDTLQVSVYEVHLKLAEDLSALNDNPPRYLGGAISELKAHWKETKLTIPNPHQLRLGSGGWNRTILGDAYEALLSRYARDHLSAAQKQDLVPVLIDLLPDSTVTADHSPADGHITLSHHEAYELLISLTGSTLPPPLSQKKAGGRSSGLVLDASETDPVQIEQRLNAWRSWWEGQASR